MTSRRDSERGRQDVAWAVLDALLEPFEKGWQQGETPDLDHCWQAGREHGLRFLAELVHVDLEYRLKSGEPVRVEPYLARFPELGRDHEALVGLLVAEYQLRCRQNSSFRAQEYADRFPDKWDTIRDRLGQMSGETPPSDAQATQSQESSGVEKNPLAPSGYEILSKLGEGGMGVVYKARQLSLNRLVALKMIHHRGLLASWKVSRFRREAEAIARLRHPNIVQVYEYGEHEGVPYFALELVEGGSLDATIAGTPQPATAAAQLVAALADAMHAAHQMGVIHRDLKPANVLLAACGLADDAKPQAAIPKITDFGLAKLVDEEDAQTRSEAVLGTPPYMAPEQAEGRTRDSGPLADVYALGAILYEMLTGRPPFRGLTVLDTLEQVRSQEPVPPSRLQPKVPRDLETICLKCLRKEPRQRYGSAEELAADLRRFQAGEPIQARPAGRVERGWRWCRRKPALAAMLALLFLVVVGSLAGLTALYLNAEQQRREAERRTRESQERFTLAHDAFQTLAVAVNDKLQHRAGTQQLRIQLLQTAQQGLARLIESAESAGTADLTLVKAHFRMGDLHLSITGDTGRAKQEYERASTLAARLASEDPSNTELQLKRAQSICRLGDVALQKGDRIAAQQAFQEYHSQCEQLARAAPQNTEVLHDLSVSCLRQGALSQQNGKSAAARELYERLLSVSRQLVEIDPHNRSWHRTMAVAYNQLGGLAFEQKDFVAAQSALEKMHDINRRNAVADPTNTQFMRDVCSSSEYLGSLRMQEGKLDAAGELFQNRLTINQRWVELDPDDTDARLTLGTAFGWLGDLAARKGDRAAARGFQEKQLAVYERLFEARPEHAQFKVALRVPLGRLIAAFEKQLISDRKRIEAQPAGGPAWTALGDLAYHLAGLYALRAATWNDNPGEDEKDATRALERLRQAVQQGFTKREQLLKDARFKGLRARQDFRNVVAELDKK